jgi:biopolymer transport protein ExbD
MAPQNGQKNPAPEEDKPRPRKRRKPPGDAKINMTPMIDVVFLLIIFFMLVTEMSKMEVEAITLPYALSAKEEPKDKQTRVTVNLTEKGKIRQMHRERTAEEFLRILQVEAAKCQRDSDGLPIMSVKIRADAKCEYKHVQDVMVQCMKAFIWKLSFGASPVENEQMLVYGR